MNIGIDVNCLIFEKAGIGRYAYNLVKNLLQNDPVNHYFLYASFVRHRQKRKKIIDDLIKEAGAKNATVKIIKLPAAWLEKISQTKFPYRWTVKENLDLYYAPYSSGIPANGFKNTVVTIYDLVFMKFPEHRGPKLSQYYLKRTKIAIQNAAKIIAISESTKRDLITMLKVKPDKIEVIPLGVTKEFRVVKDRSILENQTSKYIPKNVKYILSVGTLEPRKNLPLIAEAFALLDERTKAEYSLVFVGGKGWNNEGLKEAIEKNKLQDKVIFTGFVLDDILPYIYNRAELFVYPSLYEGFGLPPLEAMACGVPVITANTSAFPEVIGGAGVMVDPLDAKSLALEMQKMLSDEKYRSKFISLGLERVKQFNWSRNAKRTLEIFRDTVQ